MGEEWFKEQCGHIPRIELPRMPTPHFYECGSITSSYATTERTPTDKPSPRPEVAPFTLTGAIAAQVTTGGLSPASLPASAAIIALSAGPVDHDMESPATPTLSSPCAVPSAVLPSTAVDADTTPCSLVAQNPDALPTPPFPPPPPSVTVAVVDATAPPVPPPVLAQSPNP